ncbi:response regulator [Bovifimicola ammoniilytica]|jgi:DNA-binding NtrC family response regulator|uniref:response regulator n=1 Tax=Bovifimicola ammoniilytica TaxID=2981720 RepID=UPI000338A291|nr:response regulator [Bovifimicola ammoniilytica]MCU6754122.1 response regulator [Bovifimicola ammoniilytica]CCZ03685.1 response regulator containing a CheY-like receiver domain and a GGDEF domain [Eubacterium sp. CAG:603]SCJ80593.1 Chemotaxis protein CheY [uncultured Eubacterium sp.]
MKRILFVADFNDTAHCIQEAMLSRYQVQLCSMKNAEDVSHMIRMFRPDMVVVFISCYQNISSKLFYILTIVHAAIPIITIGKKEDTMQYEMLYSKTQYTHLYRPIKNRDIMKCIADRLHITEDENAEHKDISDVSNYIENEDKIKNKTDIWDEAELDNEADADKRKHILLVDNDDEIYNDMKSIIGDRYRVSAAGTELQAMRMLEKDRPDMMFLSYEMPLCEGRIMLEMIRNDEELRKLPVVFLTKIAEKRNIASIIRLKPAGCILKPLDKEIVTRIIEKCMDAKLEV